ncbi:MAG: hypothetical protein QF823_02550 [Candidatus Marinimicrobia bacterium]|nr:hypothetical protein [Candidatus Neomarinimicrobiota bacterium]
MSRLIIFRIKSLYGIYSRFIWSTAKTVGVDRATDAWTFSHFLRFPTGAIQALFPDGLDWGVVEFIH